MRNKLSITLRVPIALVLCGFLGVASSQSQAEEGVRAPSQQEFAITLARALGHGADVDGASAIALLSKLSIAPGVGPNAKWEPEAPATTKFVADVQASLQLVLKRAAEDLAIPAPPTLDLFVFELEPAPQKIFFPAETPAATPARSGAGVAAAAQPPVDAALPPPPAPGALSSPMPESGDEQ